jgi:integrase
MSKRGNGEGTISKRMRGGKVVGWRAAVMLNAKADGTKQRQWISGKTREEVAEKMRALLSDVHRGMVSTTQKLTVAEFLETWLEYKARDSKKPSTLRGYRDTVRLYLNPVLGQHRVAKLRPLDVEQAMTRLLNEGKSAKMTGYALRILKMALKQGVIWDTVARNVAEAVKPPKAPQKVFEVWTAAELQAFLNTARAHRLYAAFHLAAVTGMRRGEVLGLKWTDVDFERGCLKVQHNLVEVAGRVSLDTPKTSASRRTVFLSPSTLAVLKDHQARQGRERHELGASWQDHGFVFASEVGTATAPRNLNRVYSDLLKRVEVRRIRFHDLRHTAASLMIRQGVPPKTVSEILGHSDVAFTLRVYTHLYDDQRQVAALDLNALFAPSQMALN